MPLRTQKEYDTKKHGFIIKPQKQKNAEKKNGEKNHGRR